jgi:hypothetical protein
MNLCCDQFSVFKMLGLEQFQEGVAEQKRVLAIVEPEAYLVQVGLQMLR